MDHPTSKLMDKEISDASDKAMGEDGWELWFFFLKLL